MPHGEAGSKKRVFIGKGKLEIPMFKKKTMQASTDSLPPCSSTAHLSSLPEHSIAYNSNIEETKLKKEVKTFDSTYSNFLLIPTETATREKIEHNRRDSKKSKRESDVSYPKTNPSYKCKRKHSLGSRISSLTRSLLSSKGKGDKQNSTFDHHKYQNHSLAAVNHSEGASTTNDNLHSLSRHPKLSDLLSGSVASNKLLKANEDFIPSAVLPEEPLKRRSKSMSDLVGKNAKIQKYLDRRQVIHMDPNDEDCCCHTELNPSCMMTLAMELMQARNSKAANLFQKSKETCLEDEKESILPKLWVVPRKASNEDSNEVQLASHLKPSVGQALKVPMRNTKNGSARTNDHRHATILESVGEGVCRRSGFAYPTAKCIPMSCYNAVDEVTRSAGTTDANDALVSRHDMEHDFKKLTVADLIGSPDTEYAESEAESSSCDYKETPQIYKQCHAQMPGSLTDDYIPTGKRPVSENKENEESSKDQRDLRMICNKEDYDFVRNMNTDRSCSGQNGAYRKSKTSRTSSASSLTTVSSLSLSSNSVETDKVIETAFKVKDCKEIFCDISPKEYQQNTNVAKNIASVIVTPSGKFGVAVASLDPPEPPKRGKSFGVMDKLRKYGREKEISTRAKRLTTDCGNKLPNNRFPQAETTPTLNNGVHAMFDDSTPKSLLCDYIDADLQNKPFVKTEREVKHQFLKAESMVASKNKNPGGRTSPIFNCQDNSSGTHTIYCKGQSRNDIYFDPENLTKLEPYAHTANKIPSYSAPNAHEIISDSIQDPLEDMEGERWFRNGKISVTDGTRVALAGRHSREGSDDVNKQRGSKEPRSSHSPKVLFMSDIIKGKTPSPTKNSKTLVKEIVVSVNDCGILESSRVSERDFESENSQQVDTSRAAIQSVKGDRNNPFGVERDNVKSYEAGPDMKSRSDVNRKERISSDHGDVFSTTYSDQRWAVPEENPTSNTRRNREPVLVTSTCHITTMDGSNLRRKIELSEYGPKPWEPHKEVSSVEFKPKDFNTSPKPYSATKEGYEEEAPRISSSNVGFYENHGSTELSKHSPGTQDSSHYKNDNEGPTVYSSSLRIIVGNNAERREAMKAPQHSKRVTETNPKSTRASRNVSNETKVRDNARSKEVRETINDMKQPEEKAPPTYDTPLHSSVDETDFSGVVDGPTKNVKEIRAMFKAQDHANYAKPKQLLKRNSPPPTLPKPNLRQHKSPNGSNRNSAEVAQQVLGLFKGALEIDKDEQTPQATDVKHAAPENTNPQLPVKEKMANLNEASSPTHDNKTSNSVTTIDVKEAKASRPDKQDAPYAEIIKNPSPASLTNGHEKLSSVKQEKVLAESYDESLDQFYDVFDQLTTR